jgi:hypothetical protein
MKWLVLVGLAFACVVWFACLNMFAASGSTGFVLFLMAIPWAGMFLMWLTGEDKYDAGYRLGYSSGEFEAKRSMSYDGDKREVVE